MKRDIITNLLGDLVSSRLIHGEVGTLALVNLGSHEQQWH